MSIDMYGNKIELRLNAERILENKAIAQRDPDLFHYSVKVKVGTVPLKAVVNQLREIADYLEKQQLISNVIFSLNVDEVIKNKS
jgi:hypothetical protein